MNLNQSSNSSSLSELDQKLNQLTQVVEDLQEKQWQVATLANAAVPSMRSTNELDAELRDLKAQLQTLHLRIVGNGIQIGGVVFQCFEDVKSWVVSKVQIKR
jgi:multidrug efflux pump subunit AcrA (membrane-fusion protein)